MDDEPTIAAFDIHGNVVGRYPIKSLTLTTDNPISPRVLPGPNWGDGKFEVSGTLECRWGEAETSPLDDIQRWRDMVMAIHSPGPAQIIMAMRWWLRLARGGMTKRRWRRYRGKLRAAMRAAR